MIEIKYNKSKWKCLNPIVRFEQSYLGQNMNQWMRYDEKILIDFGFYLDAFMILVIEPSGIKISPEDWDKPLEKIIIDDFIIEKVIIDDLIIEKVIIDDLIIDKVVKSLTKLLVNYSL